MNTKRKPQRAKPLKEQAPNGKLRQPSIHLIRIPSRPARELAFRVLIDLDEMWVRLPGGIFGVSSKQLAALNKHDIPLELTAKTTNAQAV